MPLYYQKQFETYQSTNGNPQIHIKGINRNGHELITGMIDGKPVHIHNIPKTHRYRGKHVRIHPYYNRPDTPKRAFRKTPYPLLKDTSHTHTRKNKPKRKKDKGGQTRRK
jgi:hypothetical protein